MSTRSEILIRTKFANDKVEMVKLYHHHDGYPEGVGLDLLERSKVWESHGKNNNNRWEIDEVVNSLIKDAKDEYEFTAYKHTDIEYFYVIDCVDKKIKCFRAHYEYNEETEESVLMFDFEEDLQKLLKRSERYDGK